MLPRILSRARGALSRTRLRASPPWGAEGQDATQRFRASIPHQCRPITAPDRIGLEEHLENLSGVAREVLQVLILIDPLPEESLELTDLLVKFLRVPDLHLGKTPGSLAGINTRALEVLVGGLDQIVDAETEELIGDSLPS